jgi:hypothetical protein
MPSRSTIHVYLTYLFCSVNAVTEWEEGIRTQGHALQLCNPVLSLFLKITKDTGANSVRFDNPVLSLFLKITKDTGANSVRFDKETDIMPGEGRRFRGRERHYWNGTEMVNLSKMTETKGRVG